MNAKTARLERKQREHVPLRVIPQPSNGARSVLVLDSPGTVFVKGEGPAVSYECGTCGSPLLVDVKAEQVRNVVLLCANCGSYNEGPA